MKVISLIALLQLISLSSLQAQQVLQTKNEAKALNKLNAFVGTWKSEGNLYDTPFTKMGKSESISTCVWSPNKNYLIADQIIIKGVVKQNDLSIYTYDPQSRKYRFWGVNRGNSRPYHTDLSIDENIWRYTGSFKMEDTTVYTQTINRFISPSEVEFKSEYSFDKEHWITMSEGKEIKLDANVGDNINSKIPKEVSIDASYPAGVMFRLYLKATESLETTGVIPDSFKPYKDFYKGTIDLWFAGMNSNFRITESKGKLKTSHTENNTTKIKTTTVKGKAEFDTLGYPRSGPSDPMDLIPIFPDHPVKEDDDWIATAPVYERLGSGIAKYTYHIKHIYLSHSKHILAAIHFNIEAKLKPDSLLVGWISTIVGNGSLVWDCTARQRISKSYKINYIAKNSSNGVIITTTDNEKIIRIK